MELLLFWGVVGTIVGAIIGDRKGRAGAGAILGLLLGPIGWIVVGLGPDYKQARDSEKCPFCAELVKREARVCKHCGRDLPPLAATLSVRPPKSAAPAAQPTSTTPRPRIFGAALFAILVAAGIIAVVMWVRTSVVESERAEKTLKDQMQRTDAYLTAANRVDGTASPNPALTAPSSRASSTVLPNLSEDIASASPPAAPRQPNIVTIVKPVSIKIQYGIIGLPPGTKLPVVSRSADVVRVRYNDGADYDIPVSATDLH